MTPTHLCDLMRDVVDGIEGKTEALREYRVTLTNGHTHIRYTTKADSWYCVWQEAIEKYGIRSVICVSPIHHDAPVQREQLCLV